MSTLTAGAGVTALVPGAALGSGLAEASVELGAAAVVAGLGCGCAFATRALANTGSTRAVTSVT
jgi:hypothetical protein